MFHVEHKAWAFPESAQARALSVTNLYFPFRSVAGLSGESIAARGLEREGPTSVAQWEGERSDYSPGRDPPPAVQRKIMSYAERAISHPGDRETHPPYANRAVSHPGSRETRPRCAERAVRTRKAVRFDTGYVVNRHSPSGSH